MKTAAESQKDALNNKKEIIQSHTNTLLASMSGVINEAVKRGKLDATLAAEGYEEAAIENVCEELRARGYGSKSVLDPAADIIIGIYASWK